MALISPKNSKQEIAVTRKNATGFRYFPNTTTLQSRFAGD
jgi:hypothetical protein